MKARNPDLYPDNLCCLCRGAPEDNNHVWVCRESFKQQKLIWEDAVALLPKWAPPPLTKPTKTHAPGTANRNFEHQTRKPRRHFLGASLRTCKCGRHFTLLSMTCRGSGPRNGARTPPSWTLHARLSLHIKACYTPPRLTRGYDSLKPHVWSSLRLHTSLSAVWTGTPFLESGRSVAR